MTLLAHTVLQVSLDTLLSRADVITLHTPGGPSTKNLIRKETLSKCKNGVYLVNAGRGGVVNEHDLLEALESGKVLVHRGVRAHRAHVLDTFLLLPLACFQVAGAALDVFEHEPKAPDFKMTDALMKLVKHPNFICTPHLGTRYTHTRTHAYYTSHCTPHRLQ